MFKLRKVVLVILFLVGVVAEIASTQGDEVCMPVRRSRANEDGTLSEPRTLLTAGPPGKRGGVGPAGAPGQVGNPGICACDPSEIQQVRTELNADITKLNESIANLVQRISAVIDLHEPTLHEIFCTIPRAPKFGSVISSHKRVLYNQSIFYTCDKGYAMVGVSSNILVAKCQQNGTWTRETPICFGHPCISNPCTRGRCIPQDNYSYTCQCPPGYQGRNCSTFNTESCNNTVGMKDKRVKDSYIAASSSQSSNFLPKYARLDLQRASGIHSGCWLPRSPYRAGQWIQVDLKTITMSVVAIISQTCSSYVGGITRFKISHGTSDNQLQVIQNNDEADMIFQASRKGRNSKFRNNFPRPITARVFRLIVQEWSYDPALRFELITC